jgi:hypothetical protein
VNEFRLSECTSKKKRNAWKAFHSYPKTPLHHSNTMGPAAYQPLSQNKKHNGKEDEEDIVLLAATLSATAAVRVER